MRFHIPFTFAPVEVLRKRSLIFRPHLSPNKHSRLQTILDNSDSGLLREEFLAISIRGFLYTLPVLFLVFSTIFLLLERRGIIIPYPIFFSGGLSFVLAIFIFGIQYLYPRFYSTQKQVNIERNLIPALSDILVQLSSGIPLFSILVNISIADYGSLSLEFKKAVRKISAGFPEIEVLEELGERNASPHFRRALWQISNGMRAGSDITIVIRESLKSLSEEQLLQVQSYGNKLNPLVMFYLLTSVIIPALGLTFFTIISSLLGLSPQATKALFIGIFVMVMLIQTMFIGILRSVRPSLL